jgi:5-methylcytosine-specific restriction endonuclease McrA
MPSTDLNFAPWVPEKDRQHIREFFESIERTKNEPPTKMRRRLDVMEMDYHSQYLKSARWRKIKKRILERDQSICQCCGGHGRYVHHRNYLRETLMGDDDSMLATVCGGCHNLIHFDESGRKRSIEETDKEFVAGQRQTDIPEIDLDLRRKFQPPANYQRLTAVQIRLWNEERHRQRHAKWLKLHPNEQPRVPGGFFKPELWQAATNEGDPPGAA